MRKIYILFLLSLFVLPVFSQVKRTNWQSKQKNSLTKESLVKNDKALDKLAVSEKATVCTSNYVATSFGSIQSAIKAKGNVAAAALTVTYGRPDGTLFQGYSRDYKAYAGLYLHSPANTKVDYVPYASDKSATFAWSFFGGDNTLIKDPMDADGTLHFNPGITASGYVGYLPNVTATTSTESAEYVIGKGADFQYLRAAYVDRSLTADGTVFDGTEEFSPLTLGNMYANKPTSGNLYGGFSAGGSFSPSYSNNNGPCVGIMQVIPQLKSPLYTESISVLAYENGGTAVPEGGVMKIQLYYLNEDGSLGQLIGQSTTTEFVKTYTVQGAFIFAFQEEEDGFIVEKPITIGTKAPIAVVITGFDSTWHFNFLFGINSIQGSSYTLHGNDLKASTFGYSNAPTVPRADLYIQLNGIFNCLVPTLESTSVIFPVEGGLGITGHEEDGSGYNDFNLYSSYNLDDKMTNVWIESAPDWVDSFESDTTYFADYNVVAFYFHAKALPAEISGRSGEVVISSYGASVKVPVVQENTTGINRPKTSTINVATTPNSFEITNATNYTLVTLLNLAGQTIGSYNLSKGPNISIPTSTLSKGLYLLKFDGAKTETVKAIK